MEEVKKVACIVVILFCGNVDFPVEQRDEADLKFVQVLEGDAADLGYGRVGVVGVVEHFGDDEDCCEYKSIIRKSR